MATITSEKERKRREVSREKRKPEKQNGNDLTCSEAEVEDILSEGEST